MSGTPGPDKVKTKPLYIQTPSQPSLTTQTHPLYSPLLTLPHPTTPHYTAQHHRFPSQPQLQPTHTLSSHSLLILTTPHHTTPPTASHPPTLFITLPPDHTTPHYRLSLTHPPILFTLSPDHTTPHHRLPLTHPPTLFTLPPDHTTPPTFPHSPTTGFDLRRDSASRGGVTE
ncbi:hypothetical protein Pcinc_037493 [Petrolisthes cinctipes]|uniref:Uncharacterized protein n=1 Tax=Petrolisthes cinctipes TaxID=88211 RepID=A0AAE1BWE3_PETCI|nr:hypothetical protein Pcinc_037493 [Petrolisthes cinctipes]